MSDEKTFKAFVELALRECAEEFCDDQIADRLAAALDEMKPSVCRLTAGQLRALGVGTPAHVPDCAEAIVRGLRVGEAHVDPEDPSRVIIRTTADSIDFSWVEAEVIVEDTK